jgi:hypothetical protein
MCETPRDHLRIRGGKPGVSFAVSITGPRRTGYAVVRTMDEKRKMKFGQISVVHETDGFHWTSEACHFSTQFQTLE